ncbi:hypothetical protein HYU11_05375 [Candidatus Woesearchaeota archaeon]|nr:hypothetical protein [Candidatus Woesearchaeota archaeon]
MPKKKQNPKKAKKTTTRQPKKGGKMKKTDNTTGIYEETTITCPGCGRVTKMIKVAGLDTEGMICQRCAKGEIEIEEMEF